MKQNAARFTHLHCHSSFSMLDGASTPEELCERASSLGMDAIAITDTHGLYGAVQFIKAANKAGIKPVFGTELRIKDGPDGIGARDESKTSQTKNAILIATCQKGYGTLCRAVTEYGTSAQFSLRKQILNDGEGVALITRSTLLLDAIAREAGSGGLYLDLCATDDWMRLIPFMKKSGIRPVATGGVHFASPHGHSLHKLLAAIRLNTTLTALPGWSYAPEDAYLKSPEEIAALFRLVPEAVTNAWELAESCEATIGLGKLRLPKFKGFGDELLEGDSRLVLRKVCEEGARKRYGIISEEVRKRLEYELSVIEEMGYTDYFLVVADIARFAREAGVPSCGRGSAANSIVSYVLGLTHVDPIKYGLFFERFLNKDRSDAPDIDLDFSWKDRDKVLDYVYSHNGYDRVAMISTCASLGPRGAVREVAKVLGLPVSEINTVTRRIPWGVSLVSMGGEDPASHLESLPLWKGMSVLDEKLWKTVLNAASRIEGYPRHLGIHAGGIVISPSPITDIVPLETAAKGINITQWDMYPVEEAGLVKIDLLGNRSLSVIKDACAAIVARDGIKIDWNKNDPSSDPLTKDIMKRGDTMGCFYIESPAMRGLLKKLRCSEFEVLVAASSIIRPGISSSGMMKAYIERYHGAPFHYLHPKMEELLGETFGVMVYQEDVMKVAHGIAGMSLAEADGLRKSMSKKRNYEKINRFRERFVSGAVERGIECQVAKELWRQIESFAGYSFCKAHSASFALVSFQAAYLRAHHPAEFMAAVLSNYGGYYSTFAYISECRRMGLNVLPPDVNESGIDYTGNGRCVRIGLIQIKGLQEKDMKATIRERELNGAFKSIEDFLERVSIEQQSVESLIKAGAMDSISSGDSRPRMMWKSILRQQGRYPASYETWKLPFPAHQQPRALPKPKPYALKNTVIFEHEALGFPVSAHPLDLFRDKISENGLVRGADVEKYMGKRIRLLGWMVTAKPIHTQRGEPMEFVSFEDTTAIYEATFFPGTYRRFAHLLLTHGPFIITGRVDEDFGHATVTVEGLDLIAERFALEGSS